MNIELKELVSGLVHRVYLVVEDGKCRLGKETFMSLDEDFAELESDIDCKVERVTLDFVTLLSRYMQENSCNQSQLAERLDMSKAAISKLLKGNRNISIKRMVKIADRLGFDISIVKEESKKRAIPIDEEILNYFVQSYDAAKMKEQNITDYLSEVISEQLKKVISDSRGGKSALNRGFTELPNLIPGVKRCNKPLSPGDIC